MFRDRAVAERACVTVFLLVIPLVVFHRALFFGEAFLPGDLLAYVAPWSHGNPSAGAWNVLRFDGITQFYPWRLLTNSALRAGKLPFWNPYQFSASGGIPLWSNSQSAPLYPLNWVFCLFDRSRLWYAFGLSAAIHLGIAGWGTYRFLRVLKLLRMAACLGALTFLLSAPVITWLALPTFLCVAAWLPWLLISIHSWSKRVSDGRATGGAFVGCAAAIGLTLLGGHLQIALYCLLTAFAYALWSGHHQLGTETRSIKMRWLLGLAGASVLGVCLALPQVLPALELSRSSHRAAAVATSPAYEHYLSSALPLRNLVTLLFPDFFGHPNAPGVLYWNTNNYAEWACYSGVLPLFLAFYALGLPHRKGSRPAALPRDRAFFAVAGAAALLIALGTPLNAPLYFLVPGFSQTGNPARILVVFTFCTALLAAMGMDSLLRNEVSKPARERAALVGVLAPLFLAAIGASRAAVFQREVLPGTDLASLLEPVRLSLVAGAVFIAAGAALIVTGSRPRAKPALLGLLVLLVTSGDLLYWGYGYNPTCSPALVYPVTPGMAFLRAHAGPGDLVAPINRGWSLGKDGPRDAVLPPNAACVFGLHDIQGYDSLFPKTAKDQVADAAGGVDPSPLENGNMVFIKIPETAAALGARYLLLSPRSRFDQLPPGTRVVYSGSDLVVIENARPASFDATIQDEYRPASIRIGLYFALCALAALAAAAVRLQRPSP